MHHTADRRAPVWTYAARGVLWRVEAGAPEFLVGEDRLLEAKEVSYFCLDRATGRPRWEGLVPAGGWWSGIEAVTGSVVLFHGYASPDMPLHRGLSAVECDSGKIRWSHPQARFLHLEGNAAVAMMEGGGVDRLDVETGRVIEERAREAPGHAPTLLPEPFVEERVDPGLRAAIRAVVPETALPESLLGVRGEDHCILAYSERDPGGRAEEQFFRTSLAVLTGPP